MIAVQAAQESTMTVSGEGGGEGGREGGRWQVCVTLQVQGSLCIFGYRIFTDFNDCLYLTLYL